MRSIRASPGFSLVVLVTLGLFGFIGVMLFMGLLGLNATVQAMGHFSSLDHRIHDLTYAFLFGTAVVGLLTQLRAPSKNVAGQLMALIPWVGFVLAFALTNILINLLRPPFVPIFGALTLLAIILHPAGRNLFSSLNVSRVNWVMLGLLIIAAVPLLIFAATNIGLQRNAIDGHAALSHYGYMVAFSFTGLGVGLLASLRPDGWRLTAWVAGVLPALLGLASVVFSDVGSSLGPVWSLAAIAWGVAFIAAAELTRRGGRTDTGVVPDRGSTTSTPRWGVYVFGVIVIVLALLFVILHLSGGGPGLHTP